MKDLLKNDITIKIISVLIAILLWFVVLNKNNPLGNKTITVPLKIENEDTLIDKGLELKNRNFRQSIDVTVRGRDDIIKDISNSNFTAVLDFDEVNSENDNQITIDGPYCDNKAVSIIYVSSRTVDIQLEKITRKTFPVEVELQGTPKENYKIISKSYTPESFELSDVESVIDSIGSIKAVVSIDGINDNVDIIKECKVYNKDGKEIPALSKKCSVGVKLGIAKEVPIKLVVKGKPAEDFVENGRNITPEKALIKGPSSVLEKISELQTEAVDIGNADKNVNIESLIVLPEGVALVDTPKVVAVDIGIEQLARKEFTFAKEEITLINADTEGLLSYDILSENVIIAVKGKQSDLQTLSKSSLKPYVDVQDLKDGTHKLPVKVDVPALFSLPDEQMVEVKISNVEAAKEQ